MSKSAAQTFNFLSIGERGVGKTVFLLASYAARHSKPEQPNQGDIWFECQPHQGRDNIESLLKLVKQTGQYPPPTLQISDFTFDVKCHSWRGDQTLGQFCWWDVPGESCQAFDPDFQAVLLKSHGCCLFLDAYELLHSPQYLQQLQAMTKRAEAIASLADRHQLHYSVALVLTKCDRLGTDPAVLLKLEEQLQPLIKSLKAIEANFRCFYSAVPAAAFRNPAVLEAQGGATPLLWLVSEARSSGQKQVVQPLAKGLERAWSNSTPSPTSKPASASLRRRLGSQRLLLAGAGLLLGGAGLFWGLRSINLAPEQPLSSEPSLRRHQVALRRDPEDTQALRLLATEYVKLSRYGQAIPLLERLAKLQPDNLNVQVELAGLYLVTEQPQKEEAIYDQILQRDQDNILALTGKAEVYLKKGDVEEAKALFSEAERRAPTAELKSKVREIASDRFNNQAGSQPNTGGVP